MYGIRVRVGMGRSLHGHRCVRVGGEGVPGVGAQWSVGRSVCVRGLVDLGRDR